MSENNTPAVVVYTDLAEKAQSGGWVFYVLCMISLSVAFTVLMMNFYIYPMIVCTDLSMKDVIKNSFYLVALELKTIRNTLCERMHSNTFSRLPRLF